MGLQRALSYFLILSFRAGTVFRRQIMKSKDGPHAERVKQSPTTLILCNDDSRHVDPNKRLLAKRYP